MGSEGGSTALAFPVATILVVVASLSLADLGAVMIARARAQTAADAAALAAAVEIALHGSGGPDALDASTAPHASRTPGAPVGQARRLATLNGAQLVACRCPGNPGSPGGSVISAPGPTSTLARAPVPLTPGGSANRIVVEVDVTVHIRLLPGRIRIPAEARADVHIPGF